MTIKQNDERIRWRRTSIYTKRPSLGKRIFQRQRSVKIPFELLPEKGQPSTPQDIVKYTLIEGRTVILKGPEINRDELCSEANIAWYPSNERQRKFATREEFDRKRLERI